MQHWSTWSNSVHHSTTAYVEFKMIANNFCRCTLYSVHSVCCDMYCTNRRTSICTYSILRIWCHMVLVGRKEEHNDFMSFYTSLSTLCDYLSHQINLKLLISKQHLNIHSTWKEISISQQNKRITIPSIDLSIHPSIHLFILPSLFCCLYVNLFVFVFMKMEPIFDIPYEIFAKHCNHIDEITLSFSIIKEATTESS